VTHVYQQVNVEDGSQAVVAGNKLTSGRIKGRRRGGGGQWPGGRSKMGNEPLEREPIDRVRARLEALVKECRSPMRCPLQANWQAFGSQSSAMPSTRTSVG
jgi:hypothetical protein